MIRSFYDRRTEALFRAGTYRGVPESLSRRAGKQLDRLDAAARLEDLYFPRSSRFERLSGYNPPRYAIRINRQFRITFGWDEGDAMDALFEDYH